MLSQLNRTINMVLDKKNDTLLLQFIRYIFVGGIAFLADFGLLILLTEKFHVHYLVSAGVSFMCGLIVNYILSILWVFNERTFSKEWVEFALFLLIGLVGLAFNQLFMWLLTDVLSVFYIFSKIMTTAVVYFWNFFARKIFLFNK